MQQFDRTNDVRLLQEIGRSIGAKNQQLKASPIVGFLARVGVEYTGELMWVGRALNGADNLGYTPVQLAEDASTQFAEEALVATESGKPCPMRWVTQMEGHSVYNTRRSAFWQTAKAVLRALDPDRLDKVNWPSRLVWSNLYKASPKVGWNPSSRMAAVQRETCRELLLHEVKNFKPARIVFATGSDWATPMLPPEVFKIEGGSDPVSFGRIELDGQMAGRFVIAPHPMGKSQSSWVNAVTQALGSAQPL